MTRSPTELRAAGLRRAVAADVPAIRACVRAAYAKWEAVLGYVPYPVIMDYEAAVRDHEVWVLCVDNAIASVLVLIDRAPALLLENVAVAPAHQRRGFGDLLLDHALDRAQRGGYRTLKLYTNEKMHANRAWYASRGFKDAGRDVRSDRVIVHMERAAVSGGDRRATVEEASRK